MDHPWCVCRSLVVHLQRDSCWLPVLMVLQSAVGIAHVCGQGLWWAMPPNIFHGLCWDTIRIPTDRMDPCKTHCKQVPDFSRIVSAEMLSNFTSFLASKFNLVTVPLLGRNLNPESDLFWNLNPESCTPFLTFEFRIPGLFKIWIQNPWTLVTWP